MASILFRPEWVKMQTGNAHTRRCIGSFRLMLLVYGLFGSKPLIENVMPVDFHQLGVNNQDGFFHEKCYPRANTLMEAQRYLW